MNADDFEPIDLAAIREGRIDVMGEILPDWQRPFDECQHKYHVVDPKLRRVTCRDCNEVLDPIEVIISYVCFWRRQAKAFERLTKLRQDEHAKEVAADERRRARRIAKDGRIWACDLATKYEYEQDPRYGAFFGASSQNG